MFKKLKAVGKAILAVAIISVACILFAIAVPVLLTILAILVIIFIGYVVYKVNADPELKEVLKDLSKSEL